MTQQEVYNILKENKENWFTSKELADILDISMGSVTSNLKKLRKTNAIHYEVVNKNQHRNYRYTYKLRRIEGLKKVMKNFFAIA